MSFELFERVRIPDKNVTGSIVDVYKGTDGKIYYVVQSDSQGHVDDPDVYPGEFPLYDCTADQIDKIS